jgi:hypothetical protein
MEFPVEIQGKKLIFDSSLSGVMVSGKELIATKDLPLIYHQVAELVDRNEKTVRLQMSSNTSTLIPALKVLGLRYPAYFDRKDVVNSQNDITFYWSKSQLAAFYNRYSTDRLEYPERKQVIKEAVAFLTSNAEFSLPEEYLAHLKEPCKLLGFYRGFPIFDDSTGMPKLLSRLGIHVGPESVMVSTPLDEHATLVYETATQIGTDLGIQGVYKKNRVSFAEKDLVINYLREKGLGMRATS